MNRLHIMGRPAPIEPRYSTRPMRMHPSNRRYIYGPLVPMDRPRDPTAPIFIAIAVIVAGYFALRGWM